jgi:GT2 family glycosyltransferase
LEAKSEPHSRSSLTPPSPPRNTQEVEPEKVRPPVVLSPDEAGPSLPLVFVLILAYNNISDTVECLQSVRRVSYSNFRILVVDNGSTDRTSDEVARLFPSTTVMRTEINLGIPGGLNLGVRAAVASGADYVFILNNDTIVDLDILTVLVAHAKKHPRLAIAMPKVLFYDQHDLIWSVGARYRRIPPAIVFVGLKKPDIAFEEVRRIDYAPSCGLLIRREAFERVGLFDEGYRFYYDDWDFSMRVRQAGFTIDVVPAARMWHKVSHTIRKRRDEFWTTWGASSVRFYRRYGRPTFLSVAVHVGFLIVRESLQGNLRSMGMFLRGARAGWAKPLGPFPLLEGRESSRVV